MELDVLVQEVKTGLETFKTDANKTIQEQKTAIDDLVAKFSKIEEMGGLSTDLEALKKDFQTFVVEYKEGGKGKDKNVSDFKTSFGTMIMEGKDKFAGHAEKSTEKLDFNMELKDMDFDNFTAGAYDKLTSQLLPGIYATPWDQLWLRNILPNISTTSKTIDYLQENPTANATAGAAAIWDGEAAVAELLSKQEVDFNFEDKSAKVQWIAGITRIKREMLDDVNFLSTYIPQQLVYGKRGLFMAENAMILATLNANSTPYDNGAGANAPLVEKVYDATQGQLKDNYHMPTHILMNNREALKILFNKATGSGEYDLPAGVVTFEGGILRIGGVPVIGLPQFTAGTFFAMDARQSLFASRLSPEVRFFEQDRDNVIKNLITVRAEERIATLVLDKTSIIKGSTVVTP
ncbi:phage major capsid protein [Sphingobacterium multivorum]|uniref:phage major capsid family protein n=1 Tax=Sphingobacterium multivorum TaxID=28454 RepID=UPI0031BA0526